MLLLCLRADINTQAPFVRKYHYFYSLQQEAGTDWMRRSRMCDNNWPWPGLKHDAIFAVSSRFPVHIRGNVSSFIWGAPLPLPQLGGGSVLTNHYHYDNESAEKLEFRANTHPDCKAYCSIAPGANRESLHNSASGDFHGRIIFPSLLVLIIDSSV